MITHIKFASIAVKDQDRALAFYTAKLGFETVTDQPFGEGQRWIVLQPPGGQTKVVLFTLPGEEHLIGTRSNIVFTCDDVRQTYEELKGRGVEFIDPPTEQPWGIYSTFVDPDGNKFVLSSNN